MTMLLSLIRVATNALRHALKACLYRFDLWLNR